MSLERGSGTGHEHRHSSKWSQEEAMTRLLISDNSADPRFDLRHEEVLASNLMKQLTHKYGTRGKSAKFIFMQAFQESQRPDTKGVLGKLSRPRAELCDTEESRTHGFMDDFELELEDSDAVGTTRHESDDENKSKLLARPAAMVTQSHFVSRLEDQVKMEVQRNGCPAPQFEMSWLYEQIRRENPKTGTGTGVAEVPVETYSIRNGQDEPEEKLVARLKIYRRAFSALILHFQALRPLLGDIKQQYDAMLSFKDQQVAEAAKVNQNLHHLELNLEQKMASTKFEGFRQVAALEKQCLLLMRHVDRQDLAMRTITDILNKLETSLSEEHDLRRDSEDQCKLLLVEINAIRNKLGMGPRPEATEEATIRIEDEDDLDAFEMEPITTEDPILLHRALEIARKNLAEANDRLTVLEEEYADVVPCHEFEELKIAISNMENEHEQMTETYKNVQSEVSGLHKQIEKLTGAKNKLEVLVSDMRKRPTPRPSWDKVAEHIEGGLPKWRSLIDGKSSAQIVPILIQELAGRKLVGPAEFIHPLGSGSHVPPYLRWDSQIRRRNFSRRDALLVIQDIWQLRTDLVEPPPRHRYDETAEEEEEEDEDETGLFGPKYDDTGAGFGPKYDDTGSGFGANDMLTDLPEILPVTPFDEFVTDYFNSNFSIPAIRMEWIYNLIEACKNLGQIEPKLTQFLDILEGRTDEGVYHLFRAQVAKLRAAVTQMTEETNQSRDSILFGHFGQLLRELFSEKSQEEVKGLLAAVSRQTGIYAEMSAFNYAPFFEMTDEGLVGPFIVEFAKQFELDRHKYVQEVLAELVNGLGLTLGSADLETDPAGDTDVPMQKVFSAFVTADPTMPDAKLVAAITWIFLGHSMLPGGPALRGLRLVEFLRQASRLAEATGEEPQGEELPVSVPDDDEFEKAIADVLSDQEALELNELTGPEHRRWLQKKRVTNLGTVVRRLKGGAFVRHGPRHDFDPSAQVTGEGQGHDAENGLDTTSDEAVGGPSRKSRKGQKKSGEKKKKAARSASASKAKSAKRVKSKTGKKDKKKKKKAKK